MINDTYIKQCEMAEELQRDWISRIKRGEYRTDYVYYLDPVNKKYKTELFLGIHEYANKVSHILTIDPKNSAYRYVGISWQEDLFEYVWLPTLEQLFEMIWKIDVEHRVQRHYGINECDEGNYQLEVTQIDPQDQNYDREYFSDSFQGCLLQYIYNIEYNKSWNGKSWEEIS